MRWVDPSAFSELATLLSQPRLSPYCEACGGDVGRALRLYTWNVEVSSAFWGCVHAVEVGVRNAMTARLANRFDRTDWWNHPGVSLHRLNRNQVRVASRAAARAAANAARNVVPDDVIPALSLGFWSGLLGNGGDSQYETQFWQPSLRHAFPSYSGSRTALRQEMESLRLFRNRIAHHEPIFSRHLAADYAAILRVAGYLSDDLRDYIDSHSRVVETLARRERAVTNGYATRF